ncbi:MAG TPA: PAC2 family protein [Acidimicrobiales bacterium]|nr:PAC2 family protein [Acidimicrobiales bacterium]
MDHVRWTTRPTLRQPVALAAFEGWNDAGDAATTAARYLVDRWDLDLVADVDPEEFYDFTSTRPEVHLDDEGLREIIWPATEIHAGTIPGGDQDVLLIVGTEPQLRWRTYCEQLTAVAQDHSARLCVTLGALLAEVPHTRPTPIVGTAYEPEVVAGLELQPSRYEGPTGIVGVLHDAWRRSGLRSASLWATVPAYVPGAPSPKAALALVERASALLQTWVPTTDLEIASAAYERQVSELVDADEETATYVASLEQRHDIEPGTIPSADDIAEEVERFLREQ